MTRRGAYRILSKMWKETESTEQAEALDIAMNDIEFVDLMPKDMAAVVRCKDCKRSVEENGTLVCDHALPTKRLTEYIVIGTDIVAIVKPDDFCSYGERRDTDGSAT